MKQEKYKIPEGSLISYFSNKVKQHGGINLAQGIPGFQPPNELLNILNDLTHHNLHQYAPGNGNLKLLHLLNDNYQVHGLSQENLLVVQGVTEAITLLYIYFKQLLNEPFSVMAFDPVYETYSNIPQIFGDQFIAFPDENDKIDFDALEKAIAESNVKIFYIASPGNPLGKVYSRLEINKIVKLSLKYRFYLVFDAVYQDLYFDEAPYIPLDQFNEQLFYVNSFSKKLSITGWRVGYLLAAKKHINKIKAIHDYTGLCAPSILQEAIAQYLEQEYNGKDYIEWLRGRLREAYQALSIALKELGFYVPNIQGGYFIWARLPEKYDDGFRFAIDLFEKEKVAIIPGIHFSTNAKNYVRFNVAYEMEVVKEGIRRIEKFVNND